MSIAPVAASVFILIGVAFSLIAALGVVRMPDVICRMHAASKVGTIGIACIALGTALLMGAWPAWAECMLLVVFFLLTAPVAAHLIGRAAYISDAPLYERTSPDDLRGKYREPETFEEGEAPR